VFFPSKISLLPTVRLLTYRMRRDGKKGVLRVV
jgi:hypothetical protein